MDSIDSAAIDLLQTDGRISYSEMAKQLGVPRSSVSDRVSQLMRSGEIKIVAAIHPLVLGLRSIAHVSVIVDGDVRSACAQIATLDSVVFLSESVGHYQVYAELRAAEIGDISRDVDSIRGVPGVRSVEVMVYEEILSSLFHEEGELEPGFPLDSYDVAILAELQLDGRMSFGTLGERVGLSTSASRKRVLRMLDHKIMRIGAIRRRASDDSSSALFGLGVSCSQRGSEIIAFLSEQLGVEFLARTVGRFSMIATVSCSHAERVELVRQLRLLEGVVGVESWVHAEVVIERYDRTIAFA